MEYMHPQDRDEMFGDGYTNEYQRVLAVSKMKRVPVNETAKGEELARAGKFVVMYYHEVCCPHTDAVIGEDVLIHKVLDTYEECEIQAMELSQAGAPVYLLSKLVLEARDAFQKAAEDLRASRDTAKGDEIPF